MTDPLLEIAEEMDSATFEYDLNAWAARIREFWTPERQAFVQAAIEWGENSLKWGSHTSPDEARILRNEAQYICVRMDAAYRAMKEAEKGEK